MGVGLNLMPHLLCGRVQIQVLDVKVEARFTQEKHVLQGLPMDLGFSHWRFPNLLVCETIPIHAILEGEVAQKITERLQTIGQGDGCAPHESRVRTTEVIGLRRSHVPICEGGSVRSWDSRFLDNTTVFGENKPARGHARCSDEFGVDITSAVFICASLRSQEEATAFTS
jgi:hypothetical protein